MQNILFYVQKYIKDIILFLLVLICFGVVIYNNYLKEGNIERIETTSFDYPTNNKESEQEKYLNIDVKGAVKIPGVYQVSEGKIINDIITLAGGFNSNAYKDGINLSKKVTDEMVIYIYTKDEIKKNNSNNSNEIKISDNECVVPDYMICECLEEKESIIEVSPNEINKENNSNGSLININLATVNELTTLSGIGESRAKDIIKYREDNGDFKSITEIMNVSGIGESIYAKIKDYITI